MGEDAKIREWLKRQLIKKRFAATGQLDYPTELETDKEIQRRHGMDTVRRQYYDALRRGETWAVSGR